MRERERGLISRWVRERGFGFIRRSSDGPAVFVHVSGLADATPLTVGAEVEFKVVQQHKGPRAVRVLLVPE